MRWNYETIKATAKEHGLRVKDLLALASQNDPFYVGTETDIQQAEWFADVWERAGFVNGGHLRRLHYWCVSQRGLLTDNGLPYENTEKCWSRLISAAKMARYSGLVSFADVIDQKNPDPHIRAEYQDEPNADFDVHAPEIDDPYIRLNPAFEDNRFNPTAAQPYHLEVWCEKSTMNDVLLPACERYGANLVTGEGEMSITAVFDLARRVNEARKPTRIFYISDFDPAGKSMPNAVSRKLEWMIANEVGCANGADVRLTPLVLTHEQVREYDLPRTPIKASELRGKTWEEVHGAGATELDALEALHPGELSGIVSGALEDFFDVEADRELRAKQEGLRLAIRAEVEKIADRYQKHIRALDAMADELRGIEIEDIERYEPDCGMADGNEDAHSWLYDSTRTYIEQIQEYNRWKDGG